MAKERWYGDWVMQIAVNDTKGNKWSDHFIVNAQTFDEAVSKTQQLCADMTAKQSAHKYSACGTGYKLTYGGGCRW